MAAKGFTQQYVYQQLVHRAATVQGHPNEDLLTVSSAMAVVIPLLDELRRLAGKTRPTTDHYGRSSSSGR